MKWVLFFSATVLLAAGACCSTTSESGGETPPEGAASSPTPAGPNYSLAVTAPEKASVGAEATAQVVVTPKNGFKINLEYPSKLVFESVSPGAKVPAERISKRDMSTEEKRLTVPIRFTPQAPGEHRFAGELRFSVCNAQTCQMPREAVTFTTVAEGSAATPAPDGEGPAASPTSEGEPTGEGAGAQAAEGSEQ